VVEVAWLGAAASLYNCKKNREVAPYENASAGAREKVCGEADAEIVAMAEGCAL